MKKVLNFQPKIYLVQMNIIFLLLIFIISNAFFQLGSEVNYSYALVFIVLYGLNYLFYKLNYMYKLYVYIGIKVLFMSVSLYIGIHSTMALLIVYVLFSLLIFFELMIVYPYKTLSPKQGFILGLIVVIFGVLFISLKGLETNNPDIFIVITVGAYLYSFFVLYNENRLEVLGRLSLQTKLFKEAAKTNDELRLSQHKFKQIHNDMAKQKYELEVANKSLNRMSAEIYTQNELLRYISSVLDIKELIEVVTDAILGTIGVDTCSLVLFDERNEEYLFSMKTNYSGEHKKRLKEDVLNGHLQKYFESDKIHLNNRVVRQDYTFIGDRPVGSIAIIPLLRDELTYGVLIAEHATVDMFTENNIQFFSGISTQITIAINNANIYALMEEMAVKDGLTGVYNRKYLIDHIDDYIKKSDENGESVSVALFDIDRFKTVNDKYGHLFGDEAIKMAAFKTQHIAKEQKGLAVRYGGEEFVLVLPNKKIDETQKIIEELHDSIKHEALEHESGNVFIDVSIGVSTYPELATNGEELLLRADNAMYYSKEHGRGRITMDHKNIEKVV